MEYLLIAFVNLMVGICVGICGVAGFLLPMFYLACGMSATESLALSFTAFVISGLLGSREYWKKGELDFHLGTYLGAGSMVGAVLGIRAHMFLSESSVKQLLYIVVLCSGLSICFRREEESKKKSHHQPVYFILLLGGLAGALCALSGAGGPVLVMPLLVMMGVPVRMAVGISLYNSVYIGLPSAVGYLSQCGDTELVEIMIWAALFHGIGVIIGSRNAFRINQTYLKKTVAIGSVILACFKLFC